MAHRWDGGREHLGPPAPLSPREVEVLEHVRDGDQNDEIAHELGISEHTVKNHMTHVFAKLHVQSRVGAVVKALRRGVIPLGKDPD